MFLRVESQWQYVRKVALSTFFGLYICGSIVSAAPWSHFTESFSVKLKPVFNFFGMYNNYGVFSPDPGRENHRYRAVITFRDGHKKYWDFPTQCLYEGDWLKRLTMAPYSEWQVYFTLTDRGQLLLPDAARWAAHTNTDSNHSPVQVDLYHIQEPVNLTATKYPASTITHVYRLNDDDTPVKP